MPPILAHDPHTYRRLRRSAVRWTVILALPFALCVAQLVYSFVNHEASGAFVFFITGIYAIPAALFLRHAWRDVRLAREDPAAPEPLADAEPSSHLALGGDVRPPARW